MITLNLNSFFILFTHKALGSKIIHGEKAPDNSWQYMVSVQSNERHVCGGFLVSKNFVITAAHCADKNQLTSVVLGTHNLTKVDDKMRYKVKVCRHPDYENVSFGKDIMLLQLSRKVQLSKKVKLIKLPKANNKIKDKACLVAGWGGTKTDMRSVDVLQKVKVPIVALKYCEALWKKSIRNEEVILPDNVICAGGLTDKGFCTVSCWGDSGGPLVCSGKAVGVVSFNLKRNCDYPNLPNVYTDVSKYLPWINRILNKNSCN
uniref:Mast cell protease 1A-like n=1 Tax=Echeneis naucrates TaxID=173247 RepID=A0A665WUH6_ECHNA